MSVICDLCNACHDSRCLPGKPHEPDCRGLAIWVELWSLVLCCKCRAKLEEEWLEVEQAAN